VDPAPDEAVRSRAELTAAAQQSEAEAQRLRGMAEDLERRLKEAEAPKPTAEAAARGARVRAQRLGDM